MTQFRAKQVKAAKRFCWERYSHKPWFFGCIYRRDEENHVIGIDILTDPDNQLRFTYVSEYEGVPIRTVNWNFDKHGERYDREKHG